MTTSFGDPMYAVAFDQIRPSLDRRRVFYTLEYIPDTAGGRAPAPQIFGTPTRAHIT